MTKNYVGPVNVRHLTSVQNTIVYGAVIGGILGLATGILDIIGFWAIPEFLRTIDSPLMIVLTGTTIGALIGGGIGGINGLRVPQADTNKDDVKLQIREEQLDITKNTLQTGEVITHKEFLIEEKHIVVPVAREELVIEKKTFDAEAGNAVEHTETMRIPISEEQIIVTKKPEILNEVLMYKRKTHEHKPVEASVKKEKVHVEMTGNPRSKDER